MEVWSADVPFDGSHGSKDRPVIVLGRKGDTYDVLMVTTHPHDPERCMRPMARTTRDWTPGRTYARTRFSDCRRPGSTISWGS